MITKEEFLKAVETINAYLEQSKEIQNLSKRYKIEDFYKWLFINQDKLPINLSVHMKNKILSFTSRMYKYFDEKRRLTYIDEIDIYYLKTEMRTSDKNQKIFIELIKIYENLHPKTIH